MHNGVVNLEKPGAFVDQRDGVVPRPEFIAKVQKDLGRVHSPRGREFLWWFARPLHTILRICGTCGPVYRHSIAYVSVKSITWIAARCSEANYPKPSGSDSKAMGGEEVLTENV